MQLPIFQVDAFAEHTFSGNPASVCPLESWLDDATMQNIAMENNQAETAFFVRKDDRTEIRWFTPTIEVDLCGHATLASAHVIFKHLKHPGNHIAFYSHRSGPLNVYSQGELLVLDFPADKIEKVEATPELLKAFQYQPSEVFRGKSDYMLVFDSQQQIETLKPDLKTIGSLEARGVIATAKGNLADFVSRWFGPQTGIDEDPVTGSAHTTLIPYWSARLGKTDLAAIQLSKRKGLLACKNLGERVLISGKARTYMAGTIEF